MIVVADTTPLNYPVLIGQIHPLPSICGLVLIPPAVAAELCDPAAPSEVRQWIGRPPKWLELRAPRSVPLEFPVGLGKGEREAIALASEIAAGALLIDERDGRQEAVRRRLRVVGTLGVLDPAGTLDLVDVPAAISRLRSTNFRASSELFQHLLDRDAARRKL
jgi:predicted nucleic acid-binding protein